MEPFSPNDPLHTLLGRARQVEVRPDFTQNVLRAIRQDEVSPGFWAKLVEGWSAWTRPAQAGAWASLALAVLLAFMIWPRETSEKSAQNLVHKPTVTSPTADPDPSFAVEEEPTLESAVASELDGMNELSVLLAQQDTSALTDSEIAQLLY